MPPTYPLCTPDHATSGLWTKFWRTAGSDGCTQGFPKSVRGVIAARWQALFAELPKDATVLDIGCGRGAVLINARAAGLTRLSGLDRAALDGLDFAFTSADARALPFADHSFTVVTSQFGIEYAGLNAFVEAARVCEEQLWLLVHSANGPVHTEACEQADHADWLAGPAAAFTRLTRHFRGPSSASAADIDALRAAIVARADRARNMAVLEGVWHAIVALQDASDPVAATAALGSEVRDHAARLRHMAAAAPTAAELANVVADLTRNNFTVTLEDLGQPPAGHWLLAKRPRP